MLWLFCFAYAYQVKYLMFGCHDCMMHDCLCDCLTGTFEPSVMFSIIIVKQLYFCIDYVS